MGHGGALVYEHAQVTLAPATDPDALAPAQRYVLTPGVERILEVREAVLEHGVDIFALDGGIELHTGDEVIPVIPPVVEESHEPDGRVVRIINDGIHRVYAARSVGAPITVVSITGVPREFPYYALALPNGWADVTPLAELPDGFQKKAYRVPDNYKALFRDFNALFPGVQQQRKRTNPAHLQA